MRSLLQNWIIQRPVFVYLAHHYHVSLYRHWLGKKQKNKTCGGGMTGSFCYCYSVATSDTKNIRIHADQQTCELLSYSLHCEAIMQE